MKLAVAGKGGTGKTTLVALLAREAVRRGYKVLAVDADPDANLATTLGFPGTIVPLTEQEELIAERAGREGLIRLNPRVDDIPDRYSVYKDGIRLMVLGGIRRGGGGCACPANTFLRALLRSILLRPGEMVLVDMEAGIEHLGRGTAQGVDALIVVVEPDPRSWDTAARTIRLAHDIGLERIFAVANKVQIPQDEAAVRAGLPEDLPLLGILPYWEKLHRVGELPPDFQAPEIRDLFSRLELSR